MTNGYHPLGAARSAAYVEERWGPITVVTPAPADEPRTLTWRKDGTGCTWGELVAEFREGRQVERVDERNKVVSTHRGPLESGRGDVWWIGGGVFSVSSQINTTSITVWLPEVPEWAQDCDDWLNDDRLVATDDGRVWMPIATHDDDVVSRWGTRGGKDARCSTDELVAMGARLIVDRDGMAVDR